MNIKDKVECAECTSCQMCAAVCPKVAIEIKLNEDGFYRPYVNEERCVDCGLCVKVCRKFDDSISDFGVEKLYKTKLYAAYVKDKDVLRHTTSGGVADVLAKQLIEDNYKVIGVVYDSVEDCAKHKVADSIEDTDSFRGSKYIQSYTIDAFKELVRGVRNEKFAVFGLPCQIYAINKYLNLIKRRENCVLIDLYCHGCPSMLAWEKYSSDRKKACGVKGWNNVLWRSKARGWGNFVLELQDKKDSQRDISRPLNNEFFDLFFSNQILNRSCTDCHLRGTLAYTDIRLGDFWGRDYEKTFEGVSGVSLVTDQAFILFDKIKDSLTFEEKDYETFLPYQSWSHTYNINENLRSKILERLRDSDADINDCVCLLQSKRDVKKYIKHILSYLPLSLEHKVRKVLK